jgi:hypothetical protein
VSLLGDLELHSSLYKFVNLYFDIKLAAGAYPCRVRTTLRYLVTRLNEKYDSEQPRTILVDYEDTIFDREMFKSLPTNYWCATCGAEADEGCACERFVKERAAAKAEALKVLAPLKYFQKVKEASVLGLGVERGRLLEAAMELPDSRKPPDLCRSFALLLRFLEKLPDDEDTAAAYARLAFPRLKLNRKWKSDDPLHESLTKREIDDSSSRRAELLCPLSLRQCPDWIRKEVKLAKLAMHRDDPEAFVELREEILRRARKVMKEVQEMIIDSGVAARGPWAPNDQWNSWGRPRLRM